MANAPSTLVQDELRRLAKEISVQVLMHKPENIYKFTADYLNTQLHKRERKDTEIFIRDLIEHDLTYEAMLKRRGVSIEAANKASSIMQAAVRRFLGKRKVRRELEGIALSMGTTAMAPSDEKRTIAAVVLQRKFRSKIETSKKESPPGDAEALKIFVSSTYNHQRPMCMNPGISEGDIIRTGGPLVLFSPLVAAQNMGSFDEQEENMYNGKDVDVSLMATDSTQEMNENETRNFAESMLVDIISGIFDNDTMLSGKTFNQEMECLKLVDDVEIAAKI